FILAYTNTQQLQAVLELSSRYHLRQGIRNIMFSTHLQNFNRLCFQDLFDKVITHIDSLDRLSSNDRMECPSKKVGGKEREDINDCLSVVDVNLHCGVIDVSVYSSTRREQVQSFLTRFQFP
ncbi:hypothetical protein Tco_1019853, partial [Tanacetum coccineum]